MAMPYTVSLLDDSLPVMMLGEGPVWDTQEQVLYWVDIKGQMIYRYHLASRRVETITTPQPVGFIALMQQDGLLAGLQDGLYTTSFTTKHLEKYVALDDKTVRFNDGACDPQGRLYAGTMHLHKDVTGAFYHLVNKTLQVVQPDVPTSNGPAWSPDGCTMYHNDTTRHTTWQYDYDVATGLASNRRVFKKFAADEFPDGLTVDQADNLYIALYGSGKIAILSPQGDWLDEIILPVKHVTCCAFGGPDMTTLFITTAAQDIEKEEPECRSLSGRIFQAKIPTPGLLKTSFSAQ